MIPVVCASGGTSGQFERAIEAIIPDRADKGIQVREGMDFVDLGDLAKDLAPDIFIGSSKGFSITKKTGCPLLRVGFPIHDRIGGSRILHIGYRGAQQLFDRLANALIEARQDASGIGYSYM